MELSHRLIFVAGLALVACSSRIELQMGLAPNYERLLALRKGIFSSSGPQAKLIIPNPIDATQNPLTTILDAQLSSISSGTILPFLLTPTRLENSFYKMRAQSIIDSPALLAAPNALGQFDFSPETDQYSQALGYYSIALIEDYMDALGFTLNKSRPLYVIVQAPSDSGVTSEVNAFYDHAKFSPDQPRTISFYGDTQFKVSKDRDMYWHEFGHFIIESITADRGMDLAGDVGAYYSEGAALHECIADYGAESLGGKPYIGRWIARNFARFQAGQPMRSAVDSPSNTVLFSQVSTYDEVKNPERYAVAEWCTRVLWRIRSQHVALDPIRGEIDADRLIYSAVSILEQDTSFSLFRQALLDADSQISGGAQHATIKSAFESGGFQASPLELDVPLAIRGRATMGQGRSSVGFEFVVSNPNAVVARNVRVVLESTDSRLAPVIYLQGFGDLAPNATINGTSTEGQAPLVGVLLGLTNGTGVNYRLKVLVENGDESSFVGTLR